VATELVQQIIHVLEAFIEANRAKLSFKPGDLKGAEVSQPEAA
jgi:hypothetical protein